MEKASKLINEATKLISNVDEAKRLAK